MGNEEPGIILHPTKGLNAHMTRCTTCGEDGEDIILLGNRDFKHTCNHCGMVHYGFSFMRTCEKCRSGSLKKERIEEYERLPGKCRKCREAEEKLQKEIDETIEAGGILVECLECGMKGVLRPDHPLCSEVRKRLDVPKGPCGLQLEKCTEHSDAASAKNGK